MKSIWNKASSIVPINVTGFKGGNGDGSGSFGGGSCFNFFFIIIFLFNSVNGCKMISAIALFGLFITIIFFLLLFIN